MEQTPQEQAPPNGSRHPLGAGTPRPSQISLNFPLGCGPGPDPPQFPPWLWAWTRSPSTSPLGVGLETPPSQIPLNFPLGCGPGNLQGMLGYHPLETCCKACWDTTCIHAEIAPPRTEFLTHASENITLPQTSFAGDNNYF